MKKSKIFRVILVVLMALTLLLIWGNSLVGKDASMHQSNVVSGFFQNLAQLLGLSVLVSAQVVRKTAHFVAFFLLGTEATLYSMCGKKPVRRDLGRICVFIFGTAFLDETIQVFSGRGPQITDVWLDAAGGITAMLVVFALYYLITVCKRKGK